MESANVGNDFFQSAMVFFGCALGASYATLTAYKNHPDFFIHQKVDNSNSFSCKLLSKLGVLPAYSDIHAQVWKLVYRSCRSIKLYF